ncbi:MAG: hypothetical protein KKA32_07290 [Actinobacteria bacterium]|nr:hypothetical protein [Actinomycetota bacterium]
MTNLTLTIDDDVLKKARMRAASEGTTVNALVRDQLESYAGVREDRRRAVQAIVDIAGASQAGSGGRRWSRDELYGERLGRSGMGGE